MNKLRPHWLHTFIIGYSLCKNRQQETIKHLDHYFNQYNAFRFDTILDNLLQDEAEMTEAWKLFSYGYDKQGHLAVYDEILNSHHDAFPVFDNYDANIVRQYRYRFHRRLANLKKKQSERLNTILYEHILIMDVSKFYLNFKYHIKNQKDSILWLMKSLMMKR